MHATNNKLAKFEIRLFMELDEIAFIQCLKSVIRPTISKIVPLLKPQT